VKSEELQLKKIKCLKFKKRIEDILKIYIKEYIKKIILNTELNKQGKLKIIKIKDNKYIKRLCKNVKN